MKMKRKEFDNILSDCLERLLEGGETLEQCLARYPEQAAALRPLLETSLVARQASAVSPRPEFRTRAREELFLTWSRKRTLYGQTRQQHLSPFVAAIEDRLKSHLSPTSKPSKPSQEQLSLF